MRLVEDRCCVAFVYKRAPGRCTAPLAIGAGSALNALRPKPARQSDRFERTRDGEAVAYTSRAG